MDRAESTALLEQARRGLPEALDRLYERVAPRLLAIIRRRDPDCQTIEMFVTNGTKSLYSKTE